MTTNTKLILFASAAALGIGYVIIRNQRLAKMQSALQDQMERQEDEPSYGGGGGGGAYIPAAIPAVAIPAGQSGNKKIIQKVDVNVNTGSGTGTTPVASPLSQVRAQRGVLQKSSGGATSENVVVRPGKPVRQPSVKTVKPHTLHIATAPATPNLGRAIVNNTLTAKRISSFVM